jgi:hypothetical protein
MFALLERALNQGAATLGKAQQRYASAMVLGADPAKWHAVEPHDETTIAGELPLHAGIFASGEKLVALNRPPGEDQPQTVSPTELNDLFAGLDFQVLNDTLENQRSLTNEVWRTFLMLVALALIGEALLCMPPRRDSTPGKRAVGSSNPTASPAIVP